METEHARILVTVKTYPSLSSMHSEIVCTAGLKDDGSWVRLYPISYRHMDKKQRFSKYQWIEVDIVRDTRDPRPESYKLISDIVPMQKLDTSGSWDARKGIVLQNVYTNISALISKSRDTMIFTSLATFKPRSIKAFSMVNAHLLTCSRGKKSFAIGKKKLVDTVPYKFYYSVIDDMGKLSRMQIIDWEIYQLCRKLMQKYGNKKSIIYQRIKQKYFDEFREKRDIYFFLGTNRYWHIRRSKNPFMIVGVFYPPRK